MRPADIDYVPTFAGIDHIVLDSGMLAGQVKSEKIDGSDHKALLATPESDKRKASVRRRNYRLQGEIRLHQGRAYRRI